jgi:OOP family OmpA-OmpF porin
MNRILRVVLLLGVALVLYSPRAEASFYLGASATQTKLSIDESGINDEDLGWKAFAGYNFIKFFGMELTYYDMGKLSGGAETAELTAMSLAARGILPLGKHFELFAKVGYTGWSAKIDFSPDLDEYDLTYGAGFAVILGSHFEIKAEYEVLDVSDAEIDLISLGLAWRF